MISRRKFIRQMLGVGLFAPTMASSQQIVQFSGASVDVGWTTFTPSTDTHIIYVSNSTGNDRTGVVGDINHPYKTIAAGKARLRNGKPDWLLLKKGDTWRDESFDFIPASGRSSSELMLISSYGRGARPLIKTNPSNTSAVIGSFRSGGNFMAIVGLEFYAYTRDPNNAAFNAETVAKYHSCFRFLAAFDWLLVEDCKVSFYDVNMIFQNVPSATSTVRLRRCVVTDSYRSTGHSLGAFIEGVGHPFIEECVWDHNGWNDSISGAEPTIFNRNIYLHQTCGTATIIGNISANSASEGLQLRSGGTMTDNFFVANSAGFDVGHRRDADGAPAIHTATVTNNIIMASKDIDSSKPRGDGIVILQATGSGIQVNNNIISQAASRSGVGISLDGNTSNCTTKNNIIFKWGSGIIDKGSGNTTSPNDVDLEGRNDNPGGNARSESFPNPNRTVGSYYGSIGGSPATTAGFLAAARLQSKDSWNAALLASAANNYIRAGFGR
jgi:hypothetical protein